MNKIRSQIVIISSLITGTVFTYQNCAPPGYIQNQMEPTTTASSAKPNVYENSSAENCRIDVPEQEPMDLVTSSYDSCREECLRVREKNSSVFVSCRHIDKRGVTLDVSW